MSSVSKIVVLVVVYGQNCVVNEIWLYKPNLKIERGFEKDPVNKDIIDKDFARSKHESLVTRKYHKKCRIFIIVFAVAS